MSTCAIPTVSESPTLPVWTTDPAEPCGGRLLGLKSKGAAYRAVKSGHLPTVHVSERRVMVPTAALLTMLGLPVDGAQ